MGSCDTAKQAAAFKAVDEYVKVIYYHMVNDKHFEYNRIPNDYSNSILLLKLKTCNSGRHQLCPGRTRELELLIITIILFISYI